MANLLAIHSVGNSLVTYLDRSYPAELRAEHDCQFTLFSSGQMNEMDEPDTTLSLFLYRVTINEHLRNVPRKAGLMDRDVPLALDLHYLLTVWSDSALSEQVILAWAMRHLYLHPVLDSSLLTPEAGWEPSEAVQVIPTEIAPEDMMRIWDALTPAYRLSVSYIARAIHIDADTSVEHRPVVATRFGWGDREAVR